MIRRTKEWFILLFLVFAALSFPAIKAEAASTTWQEDYTFELDSANHYIKLQKYNGTAETYTVPAKATIDDVEYRTYIGTNGIWVGASSLRSLSFESGIKMGSDLSSLFYNCSQLTSLDVSKLDTSGVTNMSQMFMECSGLSSLDLTGFNTSSVTDMHMMFYGCNRLNNLNVSSFNTSNVIDMSNMFQACPLSQLDLSSFNTSKVTKMSGMFYRCEYLKKLDLSHFDTSHITSTNVMFDSCLRLEELKIDHFNMSGVTDMGWMFNKCQSLTALDLSCFDMSNVTDASSFLKNCNSLTTIKTPKNNPLDIDLPDSYYDEGYSFYTTLPKDLSSSILLTRGSVDVSAVSVDVEDQIYTGEAIEPPVTVTLGGKTVDPSNYTLTYKNNINPGTATVTVTFSGNISGSVEKTFKIKDLNEIIGAAHAWEKM